MRQCYIAVACWGCLVQLSCTQAGPVSSAQSSAQGVIVPTSSPSSLPTASPSPTPRATKTPDPYFVTEQSPADMDAILADGREHEIRVVFQDKYRFRVTTSGGTIRASNGKALIALSDADDAYEDLAQLLANYPLRIIESLYGADTVPEATLDAQEAAREAQTGTDVPNDGSWAALWLANYSPSSAKSLTLALQGEFFVRTAQIVDSASLANAQATLLAHMGHEPSII